MSSSRPKPVKILMLLGQDFLRPNTDPRVLKEAQSLLTSGYKVNLISLSTYSSENRNYEGINIYFLHDLINLPKLRNKTIFLNLPKIILGISGNLINVHRIANKIDYDIIHCHDADTLIFGLTLKAFRLGKVKLIYDSHEIATEMSSFTALKGWIKLVEKLASFWTDGFITINESAKKYILNLYPKFQKNATIIKNVPISWSKNSPQPVSSSIKIIYQGNLKSDRSAVLKKIILTLQSLAKTWRMTILTDKKDLQDAYFKKKLPNIKILDLITDQKEFQKLLAEFDLGIISMDNSCLNNYYALPNKLFDYMAAGVAVLAPNYPEIAKLVKAEKVGFIFKSNNELKSILSSIFSHPEAIKQAKIQGWKAIKARHNWNIEEKKLIKFYKKIAD